MTVGNGPPAYKNDVKKVSNDTHCSGGGGEEVFGEVAALAPLLRLRRLGRLLPSLPLRLFLRDLGGVTIVSGSVDDHVIVCVIYELSIKSASTVEY